MLSQEIGTYRDGELESVGVDHRYSVEGSIRRELWGLFDRTPDGMRGARIVSTSLADLQKKHPGFSGHWPPETFDLPWRADFGRVRGAPGGPGPAGGADHSRFGLAVAAGVLLGAVGRRGALAPVFLPGFKRDKRVDVRVTPLGFEPDGTLHLRSSVRYPALSETQVSTGDAWITPDHHLARVTFDARSDQGSAVGDVRLEGCEGTP